jgi:DNA-binding transcriptional ArsR family regulator
MTPQYEQSYARAWRDLRTRELAPAEPPERGPGRPTNDNTAIQALFLPGVRLSVADVAKRTAIPPRAVIRALNSLARDGAIYVCAKAAYGANVYAAPDHRTDDAKLLDTLRDGKERLASEIATITGKSACEVAAALKLLTQSGQVVKMPMEGTFRYLHGYRLA